MSFKLSNSIHLMERSLDCLWLRNELLSKNIANVNTPGYKRYDIKFDEYLNKEKTKLIINTQASNKKFIAIGNEKKETLAPLLIKDNSTSMRRDGNNVDINIENAELAKNTISYNVMVNQITKELSIIKQAINEGRR